ncbi:hypothetical protein Rleg9DRAFT_6079 [Rhizobium leguminosarum bv. trifolii WSM597]|uniref:Uncharacterized protein n=1 Tax=Rhizobium leguminosarum bv. trifolii WSM597 TaxID=754764 RepID=J0H9R2_RHILT|nr:hypothetical protein [Rhizobium leguminosarum]EJB07098.1 hypothetical protein Rleg9DRAFT_6079 [Rhizobium leguminosarum bv. trifolii WSM597]
MNKPADRRLAPESVATNTYIEVDEVTDGSEISADEIPGGDVADDPGLDDDAVAEEFREAAE